MRSFIESLGMNYETYYSGRRKGNLPRADDAVKIASALGVSVEWLVTGEPPKPSPAEKALQAVKDAVKGL